MIHRINLTKYLTPSYLSAEIIKQHGLLVLVVRTEKKILLLGSRLNMASFGGGPGNTLCENNKDTYYNYFDKAMSNILPLNNSDLQNAGRPVHFIIRFANGAPDVMIPAGTVANMGDISTKYIRQQIRLKDRSLANKRLKLIHNGKVLLNHTDFKKKMHYLLDEESEGSEPVKIYVHCIVGEELSPKELAQEEALDRQPEKSTSEAPKGFDRLLSQGFSAQDIQELRQQFQQIHGANLDNQSPEALRELEDRWIDSTVNNEIDEFPANIGPIGGGGAGGVGPVSRDGDAHKDLLIGVAIGYFLGIFALFLIKLEVGGILNKRTKMAVFAGVFVNLSFGFVKAWS